MGQRRSYPRGTLGNHGVTAVPSSRALSSRENPMPSASNAVPRLLSDQQQGVLKEWTALQLQSLATRRDLITDAEISKQSEQFLDAFIAAMESSDTARPHGPAWDQLQQL